jgi:SNF2 family DNA or RNA helicase
MADFLKGFEKEAKALIEENKVSELIFSEGTYQVKVLDGEEYWPFLQIDDEGKVLDSLCGCDSPDQGCEHLAAAYMKIKAGKEPLHVLFRGSFFNQIFLVIAKRQGFTPDFLKKDEGKYKAFSKTKKKLIEFYPKNSESKKVFKSLIEEKVEETEENSIKFSNLSLGDLAAYREGKAPFSLLYELSFLKDLAKWCFLKTQEGTDFKVDCQLDEKGLPTRFTIKSPLVDLYVYVAEAYLPDVIPSLNTVSCNLKVFAPKKDLIEKITYNAEEKKLYISAKSEEKETGPVGKTRDIGSYLFVEGSGFFPKNPEPLLQTPIIPFSDIPKTFEEYGALIQKHLVEDKLSLEAVQPQYHLFFDDEDTLFICPYFFKIGDFDHKDAWYSHPYVYVPASGFFPVKEPLFGDKQIKREDLFSFVDRYKGFLSDFSGFEVHTSTLETKIIYSIDQDMNLHFSSKLSLEGNYEGIREFGKYVYVKGEGFYEKKEKTPSFFNKKARYIEKKNLATFIKNNLEDLKQAEGFFTEKSPVEKLSLELRLIEDEKIEILPVIEYRPPYSPKDVFFFDPFLYVKDQGFFILPPVMQLPERFRKKCVLEKDEKAFFLNFELDSIRPSISYLDRKLQKAQDLHIEVGHVAKVTRGWQVDLTYTSKVGKEKAFFVFQAIEEGKKFLFSGAGLLYLSDLRFSWLRRIEKKNVSLDYFVFSTLQWIYLGLFEKIIPPEGKAKELFDELMSFDTQALVDHSFLKSDLRPYQVTGVKWLWFLYCHDLSGLLCDEMGLGKTHQAMALLAAVLKKDQERVKKYMVVCPTSVLYHWQNLLERFLPTVKALLYYGPFRSIDQLDSHDLLLTSYGVVRSEKENLDKIPFELIILDEVQIAKTSSSSTHKSLKKLKTKMLLGLTGTPLENRLSELKALFDVILPSYLPSDSLFHKEFTIPIEKNNDTEKQELLTSLIKPFILRRKKADVLKELPEKIEEIAICNLSTEQEKLYEETLVEQRASIIQDLQNSSKPIPFMHIFSLFSKLKQICNHPALFHKNFEHFKKHASGKWELFIELLNEAFESGQKVVVFSQYLDMLTMMKSYLKSKSIGYSMITGATKDRKEQIEAFFKDPNKKVFLASLLAAGVGIDLSCASVVIHYDRWWNPAKEDQATDRVHRIGQSRGVQVFKFICKDTIEEHIHKMIERKKRLFLETIGHDDMDQLKLLSREELISVLKRTKTSF